VVRAAFTGVVREAQGDLRKILAVREPSLQTGGAAHGYGGSRANLGLAGGGEQGQNALHGHDRARPRLAAARERRKGRDGSPAAGDQVEPAVAAALNRTVALLEGAAPAADRNAGLETGVVAGTRNPCASGRLDHGADPCLRPCRRRLPLRVA